MNVALSLAALWPLAQIALVHVYGVNPWKLAGWGMYSAPELPPFVSVECLTPDTVGRYELHGVQPTWKKEFNDFVWRRRGLGRLARPDALGQKLLDVYPTILGVEITVEQPVLDRRTGMIESEPSTYFYRRDAVRFPDPSHGVAPRGPESRRGPGEHRGESADSTGQDGSPGRGEVGGALLRCPRNPGLDHVPDGPETSTRRAREAMSFRDARKTLAALGPPVR